MATFHGVKGLIIEVKLVNNLNLFVIKLKKDMLKVFHFNASHLNASNNML